MLTGNITNTVWQSLLHTNHQRPLLKPLQDATPASHANETGLCSYSLEERWRVFFFTFQRRVCRMRAYYINTHLAESRANNDDRSCGGPLASYTLSALS